MGNQIDTKQLGFLMLNFWSMGMRTADAESRPMDARIVDAGFELMGARIAGLANGNVSHQLVQWSDMVVSLQASQC